MIVWICCKFCLLNRGNIDEKLRPCANFVDKIALFLSKDVLLMKRIIITTLITSIRYIQILILF